MSPRVVAALLLGALFVAGCTSTVVLGSLSTDLGNGGSTDLARPIFDAFDGGGGDGFDGGGGDGFDGSGGLVDLAQ